MNVPFLNLKVQYEALKAEIDASIAAVIEKTAFAGGPFVTAFEEEFAAYCTTDYSVGVSSGTSALWLVLEAMGIGRGDEVITTPNTFIATAEAISFCGATPVFVDIDEATSNMDPSKIEAAITDHTKAIIPVHLFGQMADMDPIMEIARKHDLKVIEDASQAHGAFYKGKRAGSIADAGCFSFYPGKNLGAYGEAGGVVTNDKELADRIRMIRDHGQSKKYYHDIVGWNARMDGIQGAVLSVKLKHIDAWNAARRANAKVYDELLEGIEGAIKPTVASYGEPVFHIYALRTPERHAILKAMAEKNVYCGIHYPVPLHLQKAYADLGYNEGDFPVSEKCSDEYLSLPMFPELTREQMEYAVETFKACYAEIVGTGGDLALEGVNGSFKRTSIV